MKTPRYTTDQMIAALQATRGLVYLAAKRLGCDPNTVMAYCKRHPSVEAAKQQARGALLDMAEAKLWQAVQEGEHWAICFALRTLGKDRGYTEKLEHAGADGEPITLRVVYEQTPLVPDLPQREGVHNGYRHDGGE